ncbi:hypothetical protein CCMA1212_008479 [Trichoderma ghanense]|uniref:Uncharacterized protein n=1 Tax=Trichoderma ghanense TaxID=65468 RepID=A0ABY2GUH7_9HYPO
MPELACLLPAGYVMRTWKFFMKITLLSTSPSTPRPPGHRCVRTYIPMLSGPIPRSTLYSWRRTDAAIEHQTASWPLANVVPPHLHYASGPLALFFPSKMPQSATAGSRRGGGGGGGRRGRGRGGGSGNVAAREAYFSRKRAREARGRGVNKPQARPAWERGSGPLSHAQKSALARAGFGPQIIAEFEEQQQKAAEKEEQKEEEKREEEEKKREEEKKKEEEEEKGEEKKKKEEEEGPTWWCLKGKRKWHRLDAMFASSLVCARPGVFWMARPKMLGQVALTAAGIEEASADVESGPVYRRHDMDLQGLRGDVEEISADVAIRA